MKGAHMPMAFTLACSSFISASAASSSRVKAGLVGVDVFLHELRDLAPVFADVRGDGVSDHLRPFSVSGLLAC